jgi:hypothetical protein
MRKTDDIDVSLGLWAIDAWQLGHGLLLVTMVPHERDRLREQIPDPAMPAAQ